MSCYWFTDAEGAFMIFVYKDSTRKSGWAVKLRFRVVLHTRDSSGRRCAAGTCFAGALLEQVSEHFGAGSVTSEKEARMVF